MQSTLTGSLPLRDQSGSTHHSSRSRLVGLLMIALGFAGWWYNWHLAATEGAFYIKLCLLGPLGPGWRLRTGA